MAIPATTIEADMEAVKAALAAVQPSPGRVRLFGSRARRDARPDSDLDLLVVTPQATLTPQERHQALRSLRAALRPLSFLVGVDLHSSRLEASHGKSSPSISFCSME